MDLVQLVSEKFTKSGIRNWYRQMSGNSGPAVQRKTSLWVELKSKLSLASPTEEDRLENQPMNRPDEICNIIAENKNVDSNDIYNFLTRDYSNIFRKCGNNELNKREKYNCNESADQLKEKEAKKFSEVSISQCQYLRKRKQLGHREIQFALKEHQHSYGDTACTMNVLSGKDSYDTHTSSEKDNDATDSIKGVRFNNVHYFKRTNGLIQKESTHLCENKHHNPFPSIPPSQAGKIKLSLQYFQSLQQLRVSLYKAVDLKVDSCKLVFEVAIVGKGWLTKSKYSSKKSYKKSNSVVFNECIYLKLRREDFGKLRLRLRLCKLPKRLRKAVPVGGVTLSLDGLNLDLDTATDVVLTTPDESNEIIDLKGVQLSRDSTIEDEVLSALTESGSV